VESQRQGGQMVRLGTGVAVLASSLQMVEAAEEGK
jgi:hypothetical protein